MEESIERFPPNMVLIARQEDGYDDFIRQFFWYWDRTVEYVEVTTSRYIGETDPEKFRNLGEIRKWIEQNCTGNFYIFVDDADSGGIYRYRIIFPDQHQLVGFKIVFPELKYIL